MRMQSYMLLAAGAAGLLAVAAGLLGFGRIAGAAAAVLFVLLLLLPWMRPQDRSDGRGF